MPEAAPVLIAALSARALTQAARRSGFRPLVLDLFNDADTQDLAERSLRVFGDIAQGFDEEDLLAAAARLGPDLDLVYGAGFEARPKLLAGLAAGRRLLGNSPEVLQRIKDPLAFAHITERLGIPYPGIQTTPPQDPRGWLVKTQGASGGGHIRAAGEASEAASGAYYQRSVSGRPVSALFLADGRRALVLGLSEQWSTAGAGGGSFLFLGAARPARASNELVQELAAVVEALVRDTGLVGLNSADFLVNGDRFTLLEVNPRPGATLDIFDRGEGPGLFALHCEACAGRLPVEWKAPDEATACQIVYARQPILVPGQHRWPAWVADRPQGGSRICTGEPVCTVFAEVETPEEARNAAGKWAEDILTSLEHDSRVLAAQESRA